MFIYKITVMPINKIYIGFDTKHPYKQARWKDHCRTVLKGRAKRKLHAAMAKYGISQCSYEIIEEGFQTLGELALAEIQYIKKYDSYRNGLNSSLGGDGLGRTNWALLTEDERIAIKKALGNQFKDYNKKKWANTTPEQRKEMVKNSFTPEVNARRRESLKKYYKTFPEVLVKKQMQMKISRNQNKEYRDQCARKASLKGAAVVSKPILVEFPDGTQVKYKSVSEMQRQTKQWASTLLRKTKEGKSHNGFKAWRLNE